MEERRARIYDDLRGLIEGELAFDLLGRSAYAYDHGLYEVEPLGVVAPRHEADLTALLRYAADHDLTLHPRGGGSAASGMSLGGGLVLDMSRHFRRLIVRGDHVVAQAGVVLDTIDRALAPHGRRLPVDALRPEVATVGGLVATDATGPRCVSRGRPGDHLLEAAGLLSSGDPITLRAGVAEQPPDSAPDGPVEALARRLGPIAQRLAELRGPAPRPGLGTIPLDASILARGSRSPRLVAGSHGTLMMLTRASLATEPIPAAVGAVLLPFARLVDAAAAVAAVLGSRPSCCELFDGRITSLAREAIPALREALHEPPQGLLVVGFEGPDAGTVIDRVRRLADRYSDRPGLVSEPVEVVRRADAEALLRLRPLVEPALSRLRGARRPLVVLSSLEVPVGELAGFVARLQERLRQFDVTAALDAHGGHGQVHFRPFLDLAEPADRAKVGLLAAAVAELAHQAGGSADPGRGPDRLAWLRHVHGEMLPLAREIKYAFDPEGRLNPDVLALGTAPLASRLRMLASPARVDALVETAQSTGMVLAWPERPRAENVGACHNCGSCRSLEPSFRMCPVFRASHEEQASPRGKVNLLRQVVSGAVDPRRWGSEELRSVAELCVHCKLCREECPSGVDVSGLMLEAKAAAVAHHGLTPEDWMFSRIDIWSSWASGLPRLYNGLMTARWSRWFLQRAFGLSQHRHLPPARPVSFLRRAERLGLTRPRPHEPGPRVALFLDVVANHFDQELAEATVSLLTHLGVNVYVPRRQTGCGMPALVTGDVDRARDLLHANLRVLGNAVRDGFTVVALEPTALLMFRSEALRLTDDLDASLVGANILDVGQYVAGLLARGDTPRPSQTVAARVGYHQPCHLRALGVGTPGLDLMRLVPGLEVEHLDLGCSGMAGIYGLVARNFRSSLRAGRGLLKRLREADVRVGAAECSACRLQMEQGSSKRALHPVKLLALGYGLDPRLRRHLSEPKPRHSAS